MQRAQTAFFTITIFLSAYLLFVIQPMIGKVILPSLGGTPAVWNTTMLFFQILLLGGYFYAHALSKISRPLWQFMIHFGLVMLAGLSTLPMITHVVPPDDLANPLWWQIKSMMIMIGLPFLFLSATAPLLQRWFSHTDHQDAGNPYFLYAASNLGSVLALLLYPLLVERILPLAGQSQWWAASYAGLLGLMLACAAITSRSLKKESVTDQVEQFSDNMRIPARRVVQWLFLSFVPSSLMLGYTGFITSDIGSAPLFWVIPLMLYILSFVIAFAKKPLIPLTASRIGFAILFTVITAMTGCAFFLKLELGIALGILFFMTAIMCHQELVAIKPETRHLTLFYLVMSCGGALGGIFNALLAPVIFVRPYEYLITGLLSLICWNISSGFSMAGVNHKKALAILATIMTAAATAYFILTYHFGSTYMIAVPFLGLLAIPLILSLMDKRAYFLIACAAFAIATPLIPWHGHARIVDMSRNYFGTLATRDSGLTRNLSHGTTLHGSQPLDPDYKTIPLTYYNPQTAIGETFRLIERGDHPLNVGGMGLGTGSVSCLLRHGDHIDFFEIDPDIIRIATDPDIFTYLSDCPPEHKIIQGDARLKIADSPDHSYDLLLVDVFSSDNIPLHLITMESTQLYLDKTRTDGALVFHISSRYFNLEPELGLIAHALGIPAFYKESHSGEVKGTDYSYTRSEVVVMTHNMSYIEKLEQNGWRRAHLDLSRDPWSDDFVNPLRAMSFRIR